MTQYLSVGIQSDYTQDQIDHIIGELNTIGFELFGSGGFGDYDFDGDEKKNTRSADFNK